MFCKCGGSHEHNHLPANVLPLRDERIPNQTLSPFCMAKGNGMNNQLTPLPVLITSLCAAKQMEDAAAAQRLDIEKQILLHYADQAKTDGSITDKDNGITISYGVTRKVNTDALREAWATLSENMQKAFTWEAKVVTKTLKAIQDLDPRAYAQLSNFITTTPKKTSIQLKE